MPTSYQYISVSRHPRNEHVMILTMKLERIAEYELAEAMGKELVAAAQLEPSAGVVVDMKKVVFMSSVGYGPLVSLRSCVKDGGGRLFLCHLSDTLRQMFETTRLLINPQSPRSLFEYANTLEDALEMLSSKP